jgi:hypothetical protein
MSISATTARATYSGGANGYNGTTVAGTRNKVANAITSTAVGTASYPASTVSPVAGVAVYNDSTAAQRKTAQTVQPSAGSLNATSQAIGKAVYNGIYG